MKAFARLFTALDQTNSTLKKVEALAAYFDESNDRDKLWTIAILSHRRPKRTVKTSLLRQWAAQMGNIPDWLFEEAYHTVGDLAESIALIVPEAGAEQDEDLSHWIEQIKGLDQVDEAQKREVITDAWNRMSSAERFVFNKLITGGFRMGLSQKLMTRALSVHTGLEENELAHRLMGNWTPEHTTFEQLILSPNETADLSKPYPFYLAYALEGEPENLGVPHEWFAERKWDGIRGQLIKREGQVFVWSRGEELVTDRFPEFHAFADLLPDGTVLDGEILPYKDDTPLAFGLLQKRIGRKHLTKKILDEVPVRLIAYDLLEYQGEDMRNVPLADRRQLLESLQKSQNNGVFMLSELVEFNDWSALAQERAASRNYHAEGLMLKRKSSTYQVGRKKGDWWKWKVDPLVIDAVMIYAQRGHGRRANMYTDFTFAVWQEGQLVPFAKAYSGLTDAEMREVDAFVKKNTIERFGPVRSVTPELVFEIAFEGINTSSRHKSGVALRFPRINRWRKDKPKEEANTLEDLKALLQTYRQG